MNSLLTSYIVFFGSFLLTAILVIMVLRALIKKQFFSLFFWTVLFIAFFRSRFIETQQLQVDELTIDLGIGTTVALIADTHLGVFKDHTYLQKVVDRINERSDVDLVFIAGDFLYNPTPAQSLAELFAPLGALNKPVYAVLGNHDVGVPGDATLRLPLVQMLESYNVTVLQNDIIWVNNFFLVGISAYLSGEADVGLLDLVTADETVVVLTHNPDTTSLYPNDHADLTLVGHTHCGQIRIPLLYQFLRPYLVPVDGDFDCGLSQEENTRLYITPGVGEVILPMRLFNPPTISIISL